MRISEKKEYCQIYQQYSYIEELTQISWPVSKRVNTGRARETKSEDKEHLPITVLNLIQMQNLDLSDYLLLDYPKLKDFQLFILQHTRKKVTK